VSVQVLGVAKIDGLDVHTLTELIQTIVSFD
jgi:hypothetical protein